MGDLRPIRPQNQAPNGLTCIGSRIHCPATDGQDELSETDRIIVDNFLRTLAEVALAVASRRARQQDDESD